MLHFAFMVDLLFIEALKARCIIGIFEWERKTRQTISCDLRFPANVRKAAKGDRIRDALDYKKISKFTLQFVSNSRYFLIETLAEDLARALLKQFPMPWIELTLSKPGALRGAKNVGLQIKRYGKSR